VAAVAAAVYADVVRAAGAALVDRQSVLILGSPQLARPFVTALQLTQRTTQTFHFASLADARNATIGSIRPDDTTVDAPARFVLRHSFQRFLSSERTTDAVSVVDLLDIFFSGVSDPTDLLFLLGAYPQQTYLAFASPSTPLPPALLSYFPVRLALPRLAREAVWSLLSYREVQNLLGATTLTVAHQVALHHAVAGVDVLRVRSAIDALADRAEASSPLQAIAALREIIAPIAAVDSAPVSTAIARLSEAIVQPYGRYARVETATEAKALDEQIPRGILLRGPVAVAEVHAHWLAGQLRATLLRVPGAAIETAASLLAALPAQPAVLFISDIDEALLGGEALRTFLAAWSRFDLTDLLIVATHLADDTELPPAVCRRFSLSLAVH
jgi:hypothetical protein